MKCFAGIFFFFVRQPIWSVKYTNRCFEDGSESKNVSFHPKYLCTKYHAFYSKMHNHTLFLHNFPGKTFLNKNISHIKIK